MPPAPLPLAALTLRVQNLEQRVEHWDAQFGKLLSIAGESRDAAVRAADQAVELMGQIRDLRVFIDTRCDERCGSIRRDMKDIRGSMHDHDHDELESTTGLMNRDELIDSRQALKDELKELRGKLELLSEAEQKREQAERDKRVAERAVFEAEQARIQVASQAKVRESQMAKSLSKEKIKSKTSIILAIIGIIGSLITFAATRWG